MDSGYTSMRQSILINPGIPIPNYGKLEKLSPYTPSSRILMDVACSVCRDNSSGKHYGIYACDGCAGFFKRSIRRSRQYICKSRMEGGCPIDKTHRNQCRACRLKKCLQAGMNRDAVQHERGPRSSTIRRMQNNPPSPSSSTSTNERASGDEAPPILSRDEKFSPRYSSSSVTCSAMTSPLRHNEYSSSRSSSGKAENFNSCMNGAATTAAAVVAAAAAASAAFIYHPASLYALDLTTIPKSTPDIPQSLSYQSICEAAARLLFMTLRWAKNVPAFLALPFQDQLRLLEDGWTELFVLGAAQFHIPFNTETLLSQITEDGNESENDRDVDGGDEEIGDCRRSERRSEMIREIRMLQEICERFEEMKVDPTEYACLKGIVLFKTVLSERHHHNYRSSQSPSINFKISEGTTTLEHTASKGLQDLQTIASLQDQAQVALCRHVRYNYSTEPGRFGRLLLTLPTLRSVSSRSIVELFFKRAIGNIAVEKLLVDMYSSPEI